MHAGMLNRQVVFESAVITKDATRGSPVRTWEAISEIGSPAVPERFWANLRDVMPSRAESVRLGLETARSQTVLRMRWRAGITSDMRVKVYSDSDTPVIMQIVGGPAEVGGRKKWLELVLERYTPQGGS